MAEDRSHRRGQDLVDLFQRLGSPGADKLHGEDLDWIWDGLSTSGGGGGVDSDERANFLRWLTSGKLGHLTLEKNVLTDEELRLWEELQAGRPDLILSGERLREAIKVISADNEPQEGHLFDKMSDEELANEVAKKRELLDLEETRLEELERLQGTVNAQKSTLAMEVSASKDVGRDLEVEMKSKQQQLLHINEKHNAVIEELSKAVLETKNLVEKNYVEASDQPSASFTNFDKTLLVQNDAEATAAIQQMAIERYNAIKDPRSVDERIRDLAKQKQLLQAFEGAEGQHIVQKAFLSSAKAAKVEIDSQTSKLIDRIVPLDDGSLWSAIKDVESSIEKMDKEINSFVTIKIPAHSKSMSQKYIREIQSAEVETELERRRSYYQVMEVVCDLLLDQAAVQETAGLLLEAEALNLVNIKDRIKNLWDDHLEETERNEAVAKRMEKCKENQARMSKKTLQPEDAFLQVLYKILTNSNVDPSMITKDEVIGLLGDFVSQVEKEREKVQEILQSWTSQKMAISNTVDDTLKTLEIDSITKGVMVKKEVTDKIKAAQMRITDCQGALKSKFLEWEKQKQELKGNPLLATKRQLGNEIL